MTKELVNVPSIPASCQAVTPGHSGGTTTFKYDPFGRRIQKSGPLGTTNYLYDASSVGTVLEEVDNSGNVLARFTQNVPSSITAVIDEPLAVLQSGTLGFYHQDGLRSVTSLSNSSESLANTYVYGAFGNVTQSTGTLLNPFQFTGREFDLETGVYYYRTRYYDGGMGRFVSEDPIRFKGGIDFYPYVKNKPVTFTDPTGTCLLQVTGTSVEWTLSQCKNQPTKGLQCECLCEPIGIGHQECVDDCKKGCLSPKLDAVEACQCLCDKGHENGSLNWLETKLCKYFCKKGGK